jgi:hypothetical protein
MDSRARIVDCMLVLAAQARQTDAFGRLATRWHARLLRHTARLTGDSEGAREIVQDVWVAVARGIGRLRDPASFGPWALRIVSRRSADLIREALRAEGVPEMEIPGEPSLADMVTEVFSGRMWWTGVLMVANIVVLTVLAVICGIRFLGEGDLAGVIRWGAGFFVCFAGVIGCKLWYWMRLARITMIREIQRVELLVAHLAAELRTRL